MQILELILYIYIEHIYRNVTFVLLVDRQDRERERILQGE
jgi:hypothetical protein